VQAGLGELRKVGSRHVWQKLQMPPQAMFETGFARFTLGYDRFVSASETQWILGPEVVNVLYPGLMSAALRLDLSPVVRCEALDLIGQFGLPALSPRLADLDAKLSKEPVEELRTIWSSVRVRQSIANDEDLARLHNTVSENRQHYDVVTAAIEALALADELERHADQLPKLVRSIDGSPGTLSRRTRALAATPAGRLALLELLEQGSEDLVRRDGLAALGQTLDPEHEDGSRLRRYAKQVALSPASPLADRAAANRIVYSDVETLTAGYAEEFFQMAQAADDMELLSGAMANMVAAGKAAPCLEAIARGLLVAEAKKREQAALLCSAVACLEWKRSRQLPLGVWRNVDTLFKDSDQSVRRYGPICILLLLDLQAPIPQSYVSPLVEASLDFQDPMDLALACTALTRLTDYAPPVDRAVPPAEVSDWMRRNADQVRQHLRTWHAQRQARPRP
jgi:hypothetical protein